MQIHPYVGSHWKEEINRLSLCSQWGGGEWRWLDSGAWGGRHGSKPLASHRGDTEPCAAGTAPSCPAGTPSGSGHPPACQLPGFSRGIHCAFPLPLDSSLLSKFLLAVTRGGDQGEKPVSFPWESGAAPGGTMRERSCGTARSPPRAGSPQQPAPCRGCTTAASPPIVLEGI